MSILHLSHDRQEYKAQDGKYDWKNERKVPVSGLQKELDVDHDDDGLSEGDLQAPEVGHVPGPGEVLDKEGDQGMPQGQGGPPQQAPVVHQGIGAIP